MSKIKSTAELTLPRIQSRRKGKMGRFFKDQTLKFLCVNIPNLFEGCSEMQESLNLV